MADVAAPGRFSGFFTGEVGGTILTVVLIIVALFIVEIIYGASAAAGQRFQTLMDYTVASESRSLVIHQDPARYGADTKTLGLSVNERTGVEFAYSFFLNVYPTTFSGEQVLKHVFHKGYGCPWPLMGPGVFLHGHTNTMRVVMNTNKGPYVHADISNIPLQKWFHVVLNCSKRGMDVFINGKLASRIPFDGTLPYQNFQDIILFSNANYTIRGSQVAALGEGNDFIIQGAFRGEFSKLVYTRYALSMAEIHNLMNEGPAKMVRKDSTEMTPYLADDWWAHQG